MEREKRMATRGRPESPNSKHFSFNGSTRDHELFDRPNSKPGLPAISSMHIQNTAIPPGANKAVSRRWDGNNQITNNWDGLRRDSELWFSDGDCLIYLYGAGRSRRGPSFCVPQAEIESSGLGSLLSQRSPPSSLSQHQQSLSDSSVETDFNADLVSEDVLQAYLPAPPRLSKEAMLAYNITTRNVLAFIFGIPVVGSHLGQALIGVLDRLNVYREDPHRNQNDILAYMNDQGYMDFRECADHALAALQFAEYFRIGELWADAFAHCTGMTVRLNDSQEFEHISGISRTLMKRAFLEMESRLERAGHSLSNFFEDDLSGAYLGLRDDARAHLDRFRSFLHSHYVGTHGYWPPTRSLLTNSAFPKSLYLSMYFEFRDLYLYLVDTQSTTSIQDNMASGGLCLLQNVKAFDRRHHYRPLPHPLSLLPDQPRDTRANSFGTSAAKRLGLRAKQSEFNKRIGILRALADATNKRIDVMTSPLVRDYMLFERTCILDSDEKVSAADGRKVRFMLIYAIFQTLISVTQAPIEVKDIQDVSYPLCCQIPTTPPWKIGVFTIEDRPNEANSGKKPESKIDIKPDIAYTRKLTSTSLPLSEGPARSQSKTATPPKSMFRMLSKSKTTVSQSQPRQRSPFCEILVHGYGNGLNPTSIQVHEADVVHANALGAEEQRAVALGPAPRDDSSAPSTPSSVRDSVAWSNSNSSTDESSTDVESVSVDTTPKLVIPRRMSSLQRTNQLMNARVFETPVPFDLTNISES